MATTQQEQTQQLRQELLEGILSMVSSSPLTAFKIPVTQDGQIDLSGADQLLDCDVFVIPSGEYKQPQQASTQASSTTPQQPQQSATRPMQFLPQRQLPYPRQQVMPGGFKKRHLSPPMMTTPLQQVPVTTQHGHCAMPQTWSTTSASLAPAATSTSARLSTIPIKACASGVVPMPTLAPHLIEYNLERDHTNHAYVVTASVPGFKADHIDVGYECDEELKICALTIETRVDTKDAKLDVKREAPIRIVKGLADLKPGKAVIALDRMKDPTRDITRRVEDGYLYVTIPYVAPKQFKVQVK